VTSTIEHWLKVIGSVVAVGGLILGAAQFIRNQSVEAAKPYLERKLKWCEEAVETASLIATAPAGATKPKAVPRFWQMYWGVMGLVENIKVTEAMMGFGDALTANESPEVLKSKSLALSRACRAEMADSWSPVWRR
jgi:hypothetical protein